MSQTILGISAYYHDSAACIVRDGIIIAAAQEERFSRKKHDQRFPQNAVEFVLREAKCSVNNLDAVVFYDKPFQKFNRLLETYLTFAPRGFFSFVQAMPVWLSEKLWLSDVIADELQYTGKILFTEHHESHAASAFFPSPFDRAAIVTVDGVGEYATTSIAVGDGNKITNLNPMRGSCAQTGAALTLFLATDLGIPVSTTHTITGAITGVGGRNVQWSVVRRIVWAWVFTIPAAGIISGAIVLAAKYFG